jgi:hypothetical protein
MRLGKAICIAGLIGFGALGSALADYVTFAASGTFDDGASLGGTLVIDTGTGVVESNGLDLTVVGGDAGSPGLVFDTLDANGYFFDGTDNLYYIDAADSANPNPSLDLEFDIGSNTTLAGFTGTSSMCYVPSDFPTGYPTGDNCGYYYSSYQLFEECECTSINGDPELTGGSLAPTGAPEPASWLLLLAPAALLIRRQWRKV